MTDSAATDEPPDDTLTREARVVPRWLDNLAALSWRVIVVIAFIVVLALLAGAVWTITAAILLTIIVAAIFSPFVLRMRSGGRSRNSAAGIAWLAAIGIIGGLLLIVVLAFLPHVVELVRLLNAGSDAFQARLDELDAPPWVAATIADLVEQARAHMGEITSTIAGSIANIGGILVLATFLLFFFLRDGDKAWMWTFQAMGPEKLQQVTSSGDDALRRVGGYLRGTSIVALVLAATSYVFMVALDVPLPIALSILTFGAAFVPYFGGIISGLAILLVTLAAHDVNTTLLMAVLLVSRGMLVGWWLKPRLFRDSVHLHPALVLIVLPAGFQLGGLIGLFLAVPVTALLLTAGQAVTTLIAPDDPPPLPDLVPAWLDRAAQWSLRALIALALIALGVLALTELTLVLIPLILALIFTATLEPLVEWFVARGQGRGVATAISVAGTTIIIVGVLALSLVSLVTQAPELAETAVDGAEEVDASADGYLGLGTEAVASGARETLEFITSVGTGLAGLAVVTVLSVLLTFFFLRDGAMLWGNLMRHTRGTAREPLTTAGEKSLDVLGGYMIGTGAISFVGAFSQLVIMWILGLPLALPVFVLSFFGGFIPYIGSFLTTLLAFLVAVAAGDTIDIIIMAIWTVVFNLVQGNIVAPLVYGRTTHIHPAIVLVSIPAASAVAGILGMFVVVPAIGIVAATWRTVLSILGGEDDYRRRRSEGGPAPPSAEVGSPSDGADDGEEPGEEPAPQPA